MARETLSCEFDGHFWTRETTRGRKPKRCPKHPTSMITRDGTVLTAKLEQQLASEAEAGYEIVGWVDVDPEPSPQTRVIAKKTSVTLRSTKTSKEAPQSPQEPFTPRLVTRGKGQGGKAASGTLGPAKLAPGEKALVQSSRAKDLAAAKILAEPEINLQVTLERDEKIASGEWQELYCQNGDHDWDRPTNRGRKPVNCPTHPNAVDLDANAEERRRKAEELVDRLEAALRRNGTHISQHQEKEFTVPNRPEYQDKAKGSAGSLKGSRRTVKATKRTEAEARNEKTPPERRKNARTVR